MKDALCLQNTFPFANCLILAQARVHSSAKQILKKTFLKGGAMAWHSKLFFLEQLLSEGQTAVAFWGWNLFFHQDNHYKVSEAKLSFCPVFDENLGLLNGMCLRTHWMSKAITAVYWLLKKRDRKKKKTERERPRGRSSQRADVFYLLEDVFPESTDICISWGQSFAHVKNILTSLKAAALKFLTEQRSWKRAGFIWEFIHSHSSTGVQYHTPT